MNLEKYIGKWGAVNIGKEGVYKGDRSNIEDYPFKTQWHKCIGVTDEYLIIKFSCLTLRILESNFKIIDSPDFLPFERVKYISSKDKLEIGVVVAYGLKWTPKPHKVYILEVKGKVKSTLYEKERLNSIGQDLKDHDMIEKLSKSISHALRHEPERYNIELDEFGWVNIQLLIKALQEKDKVWESLKYYDILKMIDLSDKKRHEVKTKRIGPEYKNKYEWFIRAKYGHSIKGKIYKERQNPPDVLYHGTTSEAADKILKEGLKPMDRQYVHLSQKIEEAERVGKRRQSKPVILKIDAKGAFEDQINFYIGNDKIWLSDFIGPDYIKINSYPA